EVLREHIAAFISFHNAGVVGVGDQRMSIGKTAGKSDTAEERSASYSVGVDDRAGVVCVTSSDAWLLFSSQMRMCPFSRSSAQLGLLRPSYSHTMCLSETRTSIMRPLP